MLSPQEAIQLDGQILFSLLHKVSPVAYKHLSKQKIDPILYMTEWFMCAFSRTLPWSSVLRVWDMFFCEGRGLLLQAAVWASLRGGLAAPSQGKKRAWGPPGGRGGGVPPHPVPPAPCCLTFSTCRGENHLPGGPGAAQTHPGLLGQAQVLPGPVRDHGAAEGPQPQDHAGDLPGAGGEGLGRGHSAWGRPSSGRARLEPGQDLVLGLPLSRVALWWWWGYRWHKPVPCRSSSCR